MTMPSNVHDAYIDGWNTALSTGDSSHIWAHLSQDYHGWTGATGDGLEPFGTPDAQVGFAEAAAALADHTAQAIGRFIATRGQDEAVVCYELRFCHDGTPVAQAVLTEVWRRGSSGWRLHRDVTEQGASLSP